MEKNNTRLSRAIKEALKKRLNENFEPTYKEILDIIQQCGGGEGWDSLDPYIPEFDEILQGNYTSPQEFEDEVKRVFNLNQNGENLDEAEDEDEEIELNDAPEEGEGEETTDEFDSEEAPDTGGEPSGNIKGIQDNLEAALEAAREIGDEKLVDQIGNTITFFTRTHVVKERQNVNEEVKRFQKLAGIIKG